MDLSSEDIERLNRYPERPRLTRIPFGYTQKEGDPNLLVPVPELVIPLDRALDQMDAGISLRQCVEWLNSQIQGITLSHSGLVKLKQQYRPNTIRRMKKIRIRKKTLAEKQALERKMKLANEKKKITHAKKRMQRLEDELGILRENEVKPSKDLLLELDYGTEEFKSIVEDQELSIAFKPNPGPQTAFFAADEQEVLYGGAAGGGKSYALIADPARYFSNPNFNGLILRRTNDELRDLIWNTQTLYPKIDPGARWHDQRKEWKFTSGARLWMTYLEREEDVLRYQGQAFCYIGFDELTQYPTPFVWNYMRSRLRSVDPSLPLYMRATSNPGGPGHGWVKKMFIDPGIPGEAFPAIDLENGTMFTYPKHDPRYGQPLFYRRFIPARVKDNPFLWKDGRYESNLLALPENQRKQLLEGNWDVADGAAFNEFNRAIHVVPSTYKVDRTWRRFRSCDFGYSTRQASAVHWYAVNPTNDQLVVYRELYVNQHTGRELARKIIDIETENEERVAYGVLDSSCWAQRGQSGPSIAEEMIVEGCRWKPSDRSQGSRIAGKNRLHELLRVDEFTGVPGIVFLETCKQIIATLPVIPMDDDTDDIDPKFADDHAYDSIRYGIMTRPRSGMDDWMRMKTERRYTPVDPTFGA